MKIEQPSISTSLTLLNEAPLVLNDTEGSPKAVSIEAPTTLTNSYTLKLPVDQSSGTQVLANDGSGNLSWVANGSGSGTVNSGTAGRLSLYATSTNAVSDTYIQNTHNITLAIAAQGSRSTALALTIPNPGNAISVANIVLDQGAYTIAGAITLSSALTITATTNQLVLSGPTRTATLTAPQPASASRIYTFPDQGADYSVVATEGTQTINGAKTFGTAPIAPSATLTNTTNQLLLGTTRTVTLNAPEPATTSRTYTFPDITADATVSYLEGTQTFSGSKTFSNALAITATTNQLILSGPTRTATISAVQPATSSRTYTIPDAGANANFLMSQAAQTIVGQQTFSASLLGPVGSIAPSATPLAHWAIEEGSGNTLADSVGGNTFTLTGETWSSDVPTPISGFSTQSIALNGSQYGTIASTAFLDAAANFSISLWIKTASAGQGTIISKINNGNNFKGWGLLVSGHTPYFFLQTDNTSNYVGVSSTTHIDNSVWHNLVVTKNSSMTVAMYLDGVSQTPSSAGTVTDFSNSLPLTLGAFGDLSTKYTGSIDDIRIYSTVLTQADATSIFATGLPVAGGIPSYSFSTDTNSGFYSIGAGDIALATNGIKQLEISTTAITAALPLAMGSHKITGLTNGTAIGDALAYGQSVVQTVYSTTATPTTTTSSTFQSTNLVASISPKSASNSILVIASGSLGLNSANNAALATIYEASTNLGGATLGLAYQFIGNGTAWATPCTLMAYHSPATTSSTTYTVKISSANNAATCYWGQGETMTIILLEIGA